MMNDDDLSAPTPYLAASGAPPMRSRSIPPAQLSNFQSGHTIGSFNESRLDLASPGLEIRMTLASAITHFQQQTPGKQISNKASTMQFIGDFRLSCSGGG
jgi:hypothetical protein